MSALLFLTHSDTIASVIAPTLAVLGEVLIAVVVLSVHLHVAEERRIDREVIRYMRKEQFAVILGIILIIAGYILELIFS